ncbi:MAG: cache domain-containing protein [Ramlibacter sp.]
MKPTGPGTIAFVLAAVVAGSAMADADQATAKEAEAMVKKAVAYMKANGKEKTLAEMNNKQGQFVDRDLYLSAFRLDGTNVAHGNNPKMVGKNLMDLKDSDGKDMVRDRLELGKTKASFWYDYKFVNPVHKKVEPKRAYCEMAEDLMICGGVYKPI